jgi:hypothetical protein
LKMGKRVVEFLAGAGDEGHGGSIRGVGGGVDGGRRVQGLGFGVQDSEEVFFRL